MGGGQLVCRHGENPVGRESDRVRNQDLLTEPYDEPADAEREVVEPNRPAGKLPGDVAISNDRACDELGEEQQVQRGMDGTLLGDRVATIHVHHVPDTRGT